MVDGDLGIAVFSATKFADRLDLGERITKWLAAVGDIDIIDRVILQSSDASFHCLTIVLVYRRERLAV